VFILHVSSIPALTTLLSSPELQSLDPLTELPGRDSRPGSADLASNGF